MEDLEETDKFLEIYNMPRLNQDEIDSLNRSITSNEIEFVKSKKKIPAVKSSEINGFKGNSIKQKNS